MLCSRFKKILLTKTTIKNNVPCRCITIPSIILKKCRQDSFLACVYRNKIDVLSMSSIRFLLKDLRVIRFWSVWTRNVNVGSVVRRCRKDRSVREVFQSFRQTFLRTPKSLLLSVTAALNIEEDDDEDLPPCEKNITDEELQMLLTDLETIQELSKRTIFCERCNHRLVIENKKIAGVKYCTCKEPLVPDPPEDGWMPYMEAEDVIIWRKEYKPGQGLFAYKVYGKYKDITAQDFAAIQVDGGYRKIWDTAVAALSTVERSANGVVDQAVLHWEVLWPRLFANRDYVYIRRHKEFDLVGTSISPISISDPTNDVTGKKTDTIEENPKPAEQKPTPSDQKLTLTEDKQTSNNKSYIYENEITETEDSHGTKVTIIRKTRKKLDENTVLSNKEPVIGEEPVQSGGQSTPSGAQSTPSGAQSTPSLAQPIPSRAQSTAPGAQSTPSGAQPIPPGPKSSPSGTQSSPSGPQSSPSGPQSTISTDQSTSKTPIETERPSVHSNAKRKAQEAYSIEEEETKLNKAYVIISRSCVHPNVPKTKNAIRVTEYWSNMVIRTLEGAEHAGMEFVLTYYDEPAVGGLPTAVSSFATGRAAPAFLARMRIAAKEYAEYIHSRGSVDAPDFKRRPTKISFEDRDVINEEDMESSKQGPELNDYKQEDTKTSEQATQTEDRYDRESDREQLLSEVSYKKQEKQEENDETENAETEEEQLSWWRQLYPFYYFAS